MFSGDELISAMKKFDAAIKEKGLSSKEIAMRWLIHHSVLSDGDGIIIGASQIEQVRDTVAMCRMGPLEQDVLRLTDELWEDVKGIRANIL